MAPPEPRHDDGSAPNTGSPGVLAGLSLLRAAGLLLALSSSMAADAGSWTCLYLLTGQNRRRIRRPHLDEGELAIARPVRFACEHAKNIIYLPSLWFQQIHSNAFASKRRNFHLDRLSPSSPTLILR